MCQRNVAPPSHNPLVYSIDPEWLDTHASELTELPNKNEFMPVIVRFTFLWMIFEGKELKDRTECGNSRKIEGLCKEWNSHKIININTFCCAREYFCNRYVDVESKKINHKFKVLFKNEKGKVNKRWPYDQVKKVLTTKNKNALNPHEIALAVLIVVYRYRNRLFHGPKWLNDDLGNQYENFKSANCVLKRAIELGPELERARLELERARLRLSR